MVRLHATQLPGLVYDAAVQGCISSNLFKVLSFIQIKKRIVKIQLVCILILFHFGLLSKAKFTIIALVFCFIILLLLGSSVYIKYIYWSFFQIMSRPFHRGPFIDFLRTIFQNQMRKKIYQMIGLQMETLYYCNVDYFKRTI